MSPRETEGFRGLPASAPDPAPAIDDDAEGGERRHNARGAAGVPRRAWSGRGLRRILRTMCGRYYQISDPSLLAQIFGTANAVRSGGRRVGKEGVSTCRYRWST